MHRRWWLTSAKSTKQRHTIRKTVNGELKRILGEGMLARGGQIDPNIDSIDTKVSIGIGSILA